MRVQVFDRYEFFAGVPDSQLKPLCDWLMAERGTSKHHVVAANEGNAVALAAGYYLATGKVAAVYLQNSGIGNIVNPVASLTHPKVYGIPTLYIVGWRGEPGVPDEPQHLFQGEVTQRLLNDIGIETFLVDRQTTEDEFAEQEAAFEALFKHGRSAAYIIRKNALEYDGKAAYNNENQLSREDAIREIVKAAAKDVIVSTTGKASRELYEIRRGLGQPHDNDFLTVGSMGHSSSIALGIALQRPERRVWVIDGDGASIMHMGAMATLGAYAPPNLIHVLINNGAHESVGGIPTVSGSIDFPNIARAVGYRSIASASDPAALEKALRDVLAAGVIGFIEVKTSLHSRADLGRPTTTPAENMAAFTRELRPWRK